MGDKAFNTARSMSDAEGTSASIVLEKNEDPKQRLQDRKE